MNYGSFDLQGVDNHLTLSIPMAPRNSGRWRGGNAIAERREHRLADKFA